MSVFAIPTYQVKHPNGRTTVRFAGGTTVFYSYESARRAVRKLLRKKVSAGKINKFGSGMGYFDGISRNPTQLAGYKIVRN